jgi:hypothetical protein
MPLTLAFTIAPRFGSATPRSAISKSRASSISSSRTSLLASAVEPVLWELAEIEVHEGVSGVGLPSGPGHWRRESSSHVERCAGCKNFRTWGRGWFRCSYRGREKIIGWTFGGRAGLACLMLRLRLHLGRLY